MQTAGLLRIKPHAALTPPAHGAAFAQDQRQNLGYAEQKASDALGDVKGAAQVSGSRAAGREGPTENERGQTCHGAAKIPVLRCSPAAASAAAQATTGSPATLPLLPRLLAPHPQSAPSSLLTRILPSPHSSSPPGGL